MKRMPLKDGQWRELFIHQQHSGLSQSAFCRQYGLTDSTFSNKRKMLLSSAQNHDAVSASFIQVKSATSPTISTPGAHHSVVPATEVSIPSAPGNTALLLRYQQTELYLSTSVSPRWLATLLREIIR